MAVLTFRDLSKFASYYYCKGKLIVDFSLSKNLFEPVDALSVLPDEIDFDKFIQEICDFFQSVRGYGIEVLETEDIIVIISNNYNEDGTPDFKLTLSIYKSKNKFMARANNAPNLKKFIHCYCHTWNNFEIEAEERLSEEDIIKVVGDCIIVPEKMTFSLIYEKEGFTLPEESILNLPKKENSNPTEGNSLTVANDNFLVS